MTKVRLINEYKRLLKENLLVISQMQKSEKSGPSGSL